MSLHGKYNSIDNFPEIMDLLYQKYSYIFIENSDQSFTRLLDNTSSLVISGDKIYINQQKDFIEIKCKENGSRIVHSVISILGEICNIDNFAEVYAASQYNMQFDGAGIEKLAQLARHYNKLYASALLGRDRDVENPETKICISYVIDEFLYSSCIEFLDSGVIGLTLSCGKKAVSLNGFNIKVFDEKINKEVEIITNSLLNIESK